MINDLHDFWHFSRKYMQFLILANMSMGLLHKEHELSEVAREHLTQLCRDKVRCQARIGALQLPLLAECHNCRQGCCNNSSEYYFTPIDFWLARHGSSNVHPFGLHPAKPLHHFLKMRLKSLAPRRAIFWSGGTTGGTGSPCRHLGEGGCMLPHAERPIKCHMYACSRLKRSMDQETRDAYKETVRELFGISVRTFNILKAEAKLPSHYGMLSLYLSF